MDKQDMTKVLTFISDVYPQFTFPKETDRVTKRFVGSWLKYLGRYNEQTVRQALDRLSNQDPKWPPSAAELRKKAEEIVARERRLDKSEHLAKMIENGEYRQLKPPIEEKAND